eukprot:INCI15512.2.p1 GENE.INCI15512.2~~INCI15512.2.p1  ORF type:complete len:214 (+),score=39.45 INCI15512.2:619-1260(+)
MKVAELNATGHDNNEQVATTNKQPDICNSQLSGVNVNNVLRVGAFVNFWVNLAGAVREDDARNVATIGLPALALRFIIVQGVDHDEVAGQRLDLLAGGKLRLEGLAGTTPAFVDDSHDRLAGLFGDSSSIADSHPIDVVVPAVRGSSCGVNPEIGTETNERDSARGEKKLHRNHRGGMREAEMKIAKLKRLAIFWVLVSGKHFRAASAAIRHT